MGAAAELHELSNSARVGRKPVGLCGKFTTTARTRCPAASAPFSSADSDANVKVAGTPTPSSSSIPSLLLLLLPPPLLLLLLLLLLVGSHCI